MTIWLTIAGMALVTLAVRALPLLALRGTVAPAWRRWLDEIPVAIFTALIIPALLVQAPSGVAQVSFGPAVPAAIVAALVAWRSGNVLLTLVAGMLVFWLVRWVGA
ncbi:MAG TPA: AzlD domain-containing protein [Roseiflexaceae bacterium]|nr:AzlD domain-containing protein [Roseiflexaceae bacterium]